MSKRKNKKPAVRNWLAVHAHNRRAGNHGDKRKETSRRACRTFKWKQWISEIWYSLKTTIAMVSLSSITCGIQNPRASRYSGSQDLTKAQALGLTQTTRNHITQYQCRKVYKIGDIIRVKYTAPAGKRQTVCTRYTGVITELDDDPADMWKFNRMWCFETESTHVLSDDYVTEYEMVSEMKNTDKLIKES